MYGSYERAVSEVTKILAKIDANNSGSIDYSEFMMATMDLSNLLTTEKL